LSCQGDWLLKRCEALFQGVGADRI